MGYFYHRKVYSRWTVDMDIFGILFFQLLDPKRCCILAICLAGVLRADVVKHFAQTKPTKELADWEGSFKMPWSFQCLNFLFPTLHVQLPCDTLGFIAGGGAYELCASCYQNDDGAWGGVKRRRFGARIESLGGDLIGDWIPDGREWLQEMMGETCFVFLRVVNLFVSSRPLFWACFTIQKEGLLQSSKGFQVVDVPFKSSRQKKMNAFSKGLQSQESWCNWIDICNSGDTCSWYSRDPCCTKRGVMEGEYLSSSIFIIRKHASKVLRLLTWSTHIAQKNEVTLCFYCLCEWHTVYVIWRCHMTDFPRIQMVDDGGSVGISFQMRST